MKPVAVIIADIHFTPSTLELAASSLQQAIDKAKELSVPLVIAGDTLDTKDVIRGVCANKLISILKHSDVPTYMIVGNHCLINEKSNEHTLEFLKPYCNVIDFPQYVPALKMYLAPYFSQNAALLAWINVVPKGSTIIMHQGVSGADMGHYVQDKSSVSKETFADYRVISGHYHKRQDIKCGRPRKGAIGLFSYVGNPYTLTFGEAKDPEKGYQILGDDGLLTFVPTNLRKHIILEVDLDAPITRINGPRIDDLIWVKARGYVSTLSSVKKQLLGPQLLGHTYFKLELLPKEPLEPDSDKIRQIDVNKPTDPVIMLDSTIEHMQDSKEHLEYLKKLWREIVNGNS
jgi:DNA repair exonuclease SbcCD nuclease subunit